MLTITIFASSCKKDNMKKDKNVLPPKAEKIAKELKIHDDVRIDNYYWLNERENPKVIDFLNAENKYYEDQTAHTKNFQKDLFEELKGRIKEDDESVPYKKNGYYYITRYEIGKQYPIHTRKKGDLKAEEEIIFDVNKMAEGHDYYALSGLNVSKNNLLAAFAVDTISRRQYDMQFKNLETGEIYPEVIKNTTGGSAWANDNKTVFYTKKDPVTLRSDKIYKHILDTNASEDVLVFDNYHHSLKKGGMLLISTPSDQGGSDVHGDDEESFIDEHVRDGYNIDEIQEKLRAVGFTKIDAKYGYGKPGKISWKLSMKYPMTMLNKSKAFFIILPFYYLITYPISYVLNYLDTKGSHKTGNGLVVRAWK